MKKLTCGCCGNGCLGKQHWNHDTGFGLCPKCAVFIAEKGHLDELKGYGTPGVNYAAPLVRECKPGMLVGWKTLDGEWHTGTLKEWDNGTAIVREYRRHFTGEEDREIAVRA